MTEMTDINALVQKYTDERTAPLQSQVDSLTMQLQSSQAATTAAQKQYSDLKATYDAHLKEPAPAGHLVVPPPSEHTVLLGGSYGGADESQYKGRAKVARCFFTGDLPTNLMTNSYVKQAYTEGVRAFILSWRGTQSVAALQASLKTLPADCTGYGSYFHEPEDNVADGSLKLADWRTRHKRDADAMRAIGITPVTILMAWTLNSKSGRNIADYANVGDEGALFDAYFNPAEGKDNPEAVVAAMAAGAKALGTKFTGTAETGVNMNTTSETVAVDLTKRMRAALFAEPTAALGTWWSTNEFKFTVATANAWFEGR